MSLPLKVIQSEFPVLPEPKTTNEVDPPYLFTVKQLPFLQLTRVLDQLAELSAFSNHLFVNLGNRTLLLSEKISRIEHRIQTIVEKVPETESRISKAELKPISRPSTL
jgi:hypothetical protein